MSNMSKSKTLLCSIALAASALLAQAQAPPPLIHLYPAALDESGQPVTDLTAADFQIVDQGKPETILAFRKPVIGPAAPLGLLEFSNRPGGAMPHSTAILFDMINLIDADRLDTWKALDKSLPQLDSGEDVYLYVLNLKGVLVPIHPVGPRAPDDKTWPQSVVEAFDKAVKATVSRPLQFGAEEQVKQSFKALEDIANQMAALPGRKDILWVTNGITTVPDPMLPNCNGDWVECTLYVPHLAFTLERDGVSVDPYSIVGDLNPDTNYNVDQMALMTGGHPYFRDDIRAVLKQVARDAVNSYSIVYDPSAQNWDKKWHKIRITCARKGVKLQVRERYYAVPSTQTPAERMKAILMAAFQSPYDTAGIGLRAKIAPMEGDKKGVHMDIRIDPSDLLLREQGGKYSGAVYLLISDHGAAGTLGEPALLNLNPELTAEQYKTAMKDGLPFSQDHPTSDAVQRVRIILLDQNTDEVGSLTFPVK
jgi:VWFA-related protein